MKLYILLPIFLLLAACSSRTFIQEGINIDSTSSYSTLVTKVDHKDTSIQIADNIYITTLNGKSLRNPLAQPAWPDKVLMKPGLNSFHIQNKKLLTYANYCLWVDSKAGEFYIIKKEQHGNRVAFWLENLNNGTAVGGACGTEPE